MDGKTKIDVEKIASLSALSFTDKEKRRIGKELESIVAFADALAEVDTSRLSEEIRTAEENSLRDDSVQPFGAQNEMLRECPTADGFIILPKILG